jgi:adenylate cyclase, class 2
VREVEVKFRVHDLAALCAALSARGIELGPPVRQDDQAYAPNGWSYGDDRRGVPFARLRTVDGRHLFTLKRPAENVLSCDEHETTIADRGSDASGHHSHGLLANGADTQAASHRDGR